MRQYDCQYHKTQVRAIKWYNKGGTEIAKTELQDNIMAVLDRLTFVPSDEGICQLVLETIMVESVSGKHVKQVKGRPKSILKGVNKMHTEISPSKLSRIIACPGSVKLCRKIEQQKSNSAADRGTRLHEYVEKIVNKETRLVDIQDLEERQQVEFAITTLENVLDQYEVSGSEYTEAKLEIYSNEVSGIDVKGTADFIFTGVESLIVADFKFGHIEVNAEQNTQLMAYAYGALKQFYYGDYTEYLPIYICIIQPALEKCEVWETDSDTIISWAKDIMIPACEEALTSEYPTITPGPVQCKWCPAVGLCPESHAFVQEQAKQVFKAFAEIDTLDTMELSKLMGIIPPLEDAIKAVKKAAMAAAGTNSLPGYKLVKTKGRRVWADESRAMTLLNTPEVEEKLEAKGVTIEDLIESKMKSPSRLEKLLGKAFLAKIEGFEECIESGEGTITLVTADDERPNIAENPFVHYAEK